MVNVLANKSCPDHTSRSATSRSTISSEQSQSRERLGVSQFVDHGVPGTSSRLGSNEPSGWA